MNRTVPTSRTIARLLSDAPRVIVPRTVERTEAHDNTADRSGPTERMRLLHVAIRDFLSNNLPPR